VFDFFEVVMDENWLDIPGKKIVDNDGFGFRGDPNKMRPVSISMDGYMLDRVNSRAAQNGMNGSQQIRRDLTAYWRMLDDGIERAKRILTTDEARYLARIFKGRTLCASDDVLWADEKLTRFIHDSARYTCDHYKVDCIVGKLHGDARECDQVRSIDRMTRYSLLEWLRRVAINQNDESLFEGWSPPE
jgi:hypothetical protein